MNVILNCPQCRAIVEARYVGYGFDWLDEYRCVPCGHLFTGPPFDRSP